MNSTPSVVIVLTTFPITADPAAFARALVSERLAACVNIFPAMTSIYRWQGAVEQGEEHQLIIKTTTAGLDAVRARLQTLHPYDVPECLVLPVIDGASRYLDWLVGAVR